jgi:hypothetical protein
MPRRVLVALFIAASAVVVAAQAIENRIDVVTPTAPELAPYGPRDIGVRTMQVTDKNRPDILNIKEDGPVVRYDRTLTLEVWYPATLAAGQKAGGQYRVITRDPAIMATLFGKAVRDASLRNQQRHRRSSSFRTATRAIDS